MSYPGLLVILRCQGWKSMGLARNQWGHPRGGDLHWKRLGSVDEG